MRTKTGRFEYAWRRIGEDFVNGDQGKNRAGFALAILFAINLLNFFDRNLFGALAEPIRKEWALSDARLGWLATAFTLLYAVAGLPLGWLSDRVRRPRILGIGVAAWSLLTAASGLGPELCGAVCHSTGRGSWGGKLRAGFEFSDWGFLSCQAARLGAGNFYDGVAAGEFLCVVFRRPCCGGVRLANDLLHRLRAGVARGSACTFGFRTKARGGREFAACGPRA